MVVPKILIRHNTFGLRFWFVVLKCGNRKVWCRRNQNRPRPDFKRDMTSKLDTKREICTCRNRYNSTPSVGGSINRSLNRNCVRNLSIAASTKVANAVTYRDFCSKSVARYK